MKIARHAKIIDLISRNDVETQEELADLLNGEGFRVTQATVSRDIRELKLTKISLNDGRQKYAVMQASRENMNEKYLRILKDGFLSMDMAQNILVERPYPGWPWRWLLPSTPCSGRRWQGASRGMTPSCAPTGA